MLLFSSIGFAQEDFDIKKYRTYYKFKTIKNSDNSRLLEVSFIAQNKKNRKDRIPVFDAKISFYNTLNDNEALIGTAKTNEEGIAQFTVPSNYNYTTNEDGYINLDAKFKGTKSIKRVSKSISVKDLQLEVDLVEIDSVKTAIIRAFTLDSINTKHLLKRQILLFQ